MSFKLKNAEGLNREFRGWRLLKNVAQYYLRRTGLMAVNVPGVSAMLSSTGDKAWPDIQIGIAPFSKLTNRDGHEVGSPKTDLVPGITAVGFYLRTESRGTVEIRSNDAADAPVVHANWFTANADRQHYLDLFHKTREYMRQPALQEFVGEEIRPGAEIETDEQILDTSPQLMTTGLHHTGTCRMGREGWGVVDGRLRVWGVEGLRVVDCSVMPTNISGNTNGPAMATAWRAADLILEDRGV
jgi:choline dehydrogenase